MKYIFSYCVVVQLADGLLHKLSKRLLASSGHFKVTSAMLTLRAHNRVCLELQHCAARKSSNFKQNLASTSPHALCVCDMLICLHHVIFWHCTRDHKKVSWQAPRV